MREGRECVGAKPLRVLKVFKRGNMTSKMKDPDKINDEKMQVAEA